MANEVVQKRRKLWIKNESGKRISKGYRTYRIIDKVKKKNDRNVVLILKVWLLYKYGEIPFIIGKRRKVLKEQELDFKELYEVTHYFVWDKEQQKFIPRVTYHQK